MKTRGMAHFTQSHRAYIKRFYYVVLTFVMALGIFVALPPMQTFAASNAQDGLVVNLYTDKAEYKSGEAVTIFAEVTNNNSFAVSNVKVDVVLPDGVALKSGVTATSTVSLAAGQTLMLTFEAVATRAGGAPQTGDTSRLGLWALLLVLSAGGLAALLFLKKKKGVKIFSLFLCFALLSVLVAPALPVKAATVGKSFAVSESFKAGGTTYAITATASYDWDDGSTPPVPTYTVTMSNDGNGTASASPASAAAGTQITIAATPTDSARYQFKQWVVVSGSVTLSSMTTSPATFNMPADAVEIKAEFEPTAALRAANDEAAKITGFEADSVTTNTSSTLGFPARTSSALDAGTTILFVSTSIPLGGSMNGTTGALSLNTKDVVEAADAELTSVTVTFTATLNGVTSDQKTLSISGLFGADTTADKLRNDNLNLSYGLEVISNTPGTINVTKIDTSVPVVMSAGVSIPTAYDYTGSESVSAAESGNLVMNLQTPRNDYVDFTVQLECAGTAYQKNIVISLQNH